MSSIFVQPIILCGGSGTRLWPLSRAEFPKQFLSLLGKESLFQLAVERTTKLAHKEFTVAAPLVVANEEHRFLILDQLQAIHQQPSSILLEPVGRNTAPALTLAALAALEVGNDPVLVVNPADHLVLDIPAFVETLQSAIKVAEEGAIVTLGIMPDRPETGYGYIRTKKEHGVHTVENFVEKPDPATAERYLAENCYYWNSGIFILKASVWLAALKTFRPDIAETMDTAWQSHQKDGAFIRPGQKEFAVAPAESIDYAVMEKCPGGKFAIKMLPLAAGWSDLGSWNAAWQSADKDSQGNAHIGDAMIRDSNNVFVHASSRLVSVVGLDDVVVIETADAVLVTDRKRSQDVRKIVADLGSNAREEHTQNRKVHRPWGWYDSIDQGPGFKVKRILVKPGASLSLQVHQKRAEHWVVVSGTAEITCGEKTLQLHENQSTYIPLGVAHRLANPGTKPLEIIEIQSGDYLSEDDIVRLDDHYGRMRKAS
jgi:mannose-1-phosphate guanylyltransferase/mannose-6-phosphate isomerase